MASSLTTGSLTGDERRWIVVGVCLNKVILPTLRNVVATELQKLYNLLSKPPDEIHKQSIATYKNTLPPSAFRLNYKSINNNEKKPGHTYDFAVKDSLSLTKLFMQPHMAKCTGFDDTMDMSAILAVMCNATPFSSAAADAKIVRNIRNKWAHCNFSEWTQAEFTASIQDLISFIKTSNLPKADEKAVCDDLDDWEKKGISIELFII
jgi:hypothetical protein